MAKRIYLATPVGESLKEDAKPRLVNANTPAAARLHVTRSLYDIRTATSGEVAHLLTKGGVKEVEEAGDEVGTGTLPGTEPAA